MQTQNSSVQRQKNYLAQLGKEKFKFTLTVGNAFVRGMRDIGYKHTGTALDELVDNSYESGASHVYVVLHDDGSGRKNNVSQIAVIDNGCGMIPDMIRVAMLWGGTDRENNRTGLGRFGYGMPSASVSQGQRFTVYSMQQGGRLHACTMDLEDIKNGKYTDDVGDIVLPAPKADKLPGFVQQYIDKNLPEGFDRGTVVVLDKLDRLTHKTMGALQNLLLEHFGVVYHKFRDRFTIKVNDTHVDPIDPLFLTPGYRWYDLDEMRATALDPMRIDVKDAEKNVIGQMTVRFSWLPYGFASIDKAKKAQGTNQNERSSVMREYNGFIIARMGRVIEVVRHSPLTTFMTNDAYIKIEIDFDARLDEFFNVPTSKQRVDVSDKIWTMLREHGLLKALEHLRGAREKTKAVMESTADSGIGEARASEEAMAATAKLAPVLPLPVVERQQEAARRSLEQEATRRSRESGKPVEDALAEVQAELGGRAYKVAYRSVPGGAFFDVEQLGGTKVLWLNTSTRFFTEVHSGPNSTPAVRAALEILLFSIGDRKLEGHQELQAFYNHEIPEWSKKLEFALAHLAQHVAAETHDEQPGDLAA